MGFEEIEKGWAARWITYLEGSKRWEKAGSSNLESLEQSEEGRKVGCSVEESGREGKVAGKVVGSNRGFD